MYAAGSEDMDTLTFNSPILLRHLTFSEAKKMPISCIELKTALEELEMSMDQVSIPPTPTPDSLAGTLRIGRANVEDGCSITL